MNTIVDEQVTKEIIEKDTTDGHKNANATITILEKPASGRKKLLLRAGLAVLVLALGVGSYVIWSSSHYESTDDAFIDGHIIPISPKVSGQISKVYVTDNQEVKKGDMLFEIDARDYEAKAEEQRAKVASSAAQALRSTADAVRYVQLYAKDEASQQQRDLTEASARSAAATLKRDQAVLKTAELNLSYTKVSAPESGRVARKSVEEGAYVQVGQSLLAIVPEKVWVTANFKETQLSHMQPDQPVTVKVDAYPERSFRAHVDSLQLGTGERFSLLPPENATGNYVKVVQRVPVKIVFDEAIDAHYQLAPGMSVVPSVKVR